MTRWRPATSLDKPSARRNRRWLRVLLGTWIVLASLAAARSFWLGGVVEAPRGIASIAFAAALALVGFASVLRPAAPPLRLLPGLVAAAGLTAIVLAPMVLAR